MSDENRDRLCAEVLAIGDEITSGQALDTNSQWLSRRLEGLGVRVLYHTTVGDELAPMIAVFRQAIERADVVVATGGLGPTADDLTRTALADAAGVQLVLVPEALEHVRRLFARRKREMAPSNELQAWFPAGSRVIPNPEGTAPGIDCELPRPGRAACRFFSLPGVPAEMRQMWDTIETELRSRGAGRHVICRKDIKCFGAGESQLEAMLPDLIRRGRTPTVGINASQATIILRIAAEGSTQEECEAQIESTAAIIHHSLGTLVYGQDADELQDAVVRLLRERKRTLATVEIGTAGLVADLLGGAAGGEGFYRGGLVLRDEAAVAKLLGVEAGPLLGEPASGSTVRAMAVACREWFQADYGLAVGPCPKTPADAAQPGSLHLPLAGPAGVETRALPLGLPADLQRIYCAKSAMNLARLTLLKG
jgi:nicotinamide-nucleotide amidase